LDYKYCLGVDKEEIQRPGDVAGSYCNADTAKRLLGWQAELSIEQGISDALKWDERRAQMLLLK
jgi:UDP-glucose 4-epimerase